MFQDLDCEGIGVKAIPVVIGQCVYVIFLPFEYAIAFCQIPSIVPTMDSSIDQIRDASFDQRLLHNSFRNTFCFVET
jgi:hypothetical protein